MKKQVRAMETQLTKLRADADRLEERLEAVELNASVAARATRSRTDAEATERPRLKVIRLSPDEEAPAEGAAPAATPAAPPPEEVEKDGARPVIRGKGENVIKTGASVQWRSGGIAGKSETVLNEGRRPARQPRLSPPFPGLRGTRRVSSEG